MGRNRRILPPAEHWAVNVDRVGRWVLIDQDGHDPLRHPDRVKRVHALYLAAQAPPLLVAVRELARTVDYLSTPYHRFTPLLEYASITVSLTVPPAEILAQIEPRRHQGELDLEAA